VLAPATAHVLLDNARIGLLLEIFQSGLKAFFLSNWRRLTFFRGWFAGHQFHAAGVDQFHAAGVEEVIDGEKRAQG